MTIQTDVLPQVGDIVAGGKFRICPGGKGANEAIAASRLGGSVSLITRVRDKNLQFTTKLKDTVHWATCQGRPIYLHRFNLIPEGKLPV